MTIQAAELLGYKVIEASPFEVGLTRYGWPIKTWWCQDFDRKLPKLDHPLIQEAIKEDQKDKWVKKTMCGNNL